MAAKCKDVLLTLRFYSQKPSFVTALPDGSARKERQPKGSKATWLAQREPMGKRPPTGASIP
ncbi:hypothetical protein CSV72_11505 [Sporosarcina sp. P20a]|nr:hypothetical protein CSV72_11505 [Sporosarcina sp. P20a]